MAQGQNRLPSSQLLAAQEKKKLHDCLCSSAAVGGEERSHGCFCEEANATYWRLLAATAKEMWLVVVCRHCWCGKGKGCGSEGGRKKKRKKEEKGEGVTALP